MQTFVPYPDLRASCQVLDGPRLGKQRVETFQILRALTWPSYAWKNHPAVRMWRGFVPGLVLYGVESCREWTRRGNADSVLPQLLDWTGGQVPDDPAMPPWWGLEALHLSHRARLVHKDPEAYRPLFGDLPDLPYLWPPDVFPRWPVRTGGRRLDLEQALGVLGLAEPRDGQAEAAHAVADGHDCVLVARPGHGGPTAGLLGGLLTPGRTLWVSPDAYPDPQPVPPVALVPPRPAVAPAAAPEPDGDGDGDGEAAEKAPALARPPSEQDRAAMRAEAAAPEWLFARPGPLPPLDGVGLVVVTGADAVVALDLGPDRPPVLAVVPRADGAERAELAARLGLRHPVHAAGGWDPAATWLGVATARSAQARGRAVAALARTAGPALVVAAGRDRADRLAGSLVTAGLRAASWAPGMRPPRAAAAVAAWRTRRLSALVVPAGSAPPLGRARVRLLVHADAVEPAAWRDVLAELAPEAAVLLVGPEAGEEAAALAASRGCRRAALLAPVGEPVAVPCGRCDVCAPAAGPDLSATALAGPSAAPRRASASRGG